MSQAECRLLIEQNLISENFCESPQGAMFCRSEDGRLSVMVNEEDHFRIQLIEPGLELLTAGQDIQEFEFHLERLLEFAYAEPFGYLTSCVSNLGTGLRASVMLHVPALVFRKELEPLLKGTRFQDLTLRGAFGEGSTYESGFVQVSNTQTLGLTEGLYVDYLSQCVKLIVEAEREARKRYLKEDALDFGLAVFNSLETLRWTAGLCSTEATKHLSRVRLAACCGLIEGLKPQEAHRLLVETRPAHLQVQNGGKAGPEQRDKIRAEILNEAFAKVVQVGIPTSLKSPFSGPSKPAESSSSQKEWENMPQAAEWSASGSEPEVTWPETWEKETPGYEYEAPKLNKDHFGYIPPTLDKEYLGQAPLQGDVEKLFDEPTKDDLLDVSWFKVPKIETKKLPSEMSVFRDWVKRLHTTGLIHPLRLGMDREAFWKALGRSGEPSYDSDTIFIEGYEFGFSFGNRLKLIACRRSTGEYRILIQSD